MTDILEYYFWFAVTTALVASYELLYPVINKRIQDISPEKVDNIFVMYMSFFCVSVMIAPMVFLSCIIPSFSERFRHSLYTGIFPQE